MTLVEFRTNLAWALIENDYLDKEKAVESNKRRKRAGVEYILRTTPKKAKNWDGQKCIFLRQWTTRNFGVRKKDVENQFRPIVSVMIRVGSTEIASQNMFWNKLDSLK